VQKNVASAELPVLEYAYEMAGAIVVRRHGEWFRIRLDDGAGWIRSDRSRFMPIEELLSENLTYVAWPYSDGLASAPGE
jgi:hypothetical protein